MSEPQTPTGKRMLGWLRYCEQSGDPHPPSETGRLALVDIEAEAIAIGAKAERQRIFAKARLGHDMFRGLHQHRHPWSHCTDPRCADLRVLLAEPEAERVKP